MFVFYRKPLPKFQYRSCKSENDEGIVLQTLSIFLETPKIDQDFSNEKLLVQSPYWKHTVQTRMFQTVPENHWILFSTFSTFEGKKSTLNPN